MIDLATLLTIAAVAAALWRQYRRVSRQLAQALDRLEASRLDARLARYRIHTALAGIPAAALVPREVVITGDIARQLRSLASEAHSALVRAAEHSADPVKCSDALQAAVAAIQAALALVQPPPPPPE